MCDRVRRGKDSREETCWCVTGSEEGRIVVGDLLVCDRVRRGKDSWEGTCCCVTGSEEGRIVGRRPVGV